MPHSGRFAPWDETRYPFHRRLCGPKSPSGRVEENLYSTGIRSPDSPAPGESLYRLSCHSHLNTEVKNKWSYNATPQYAFLSRHFVKHVVASPDGCAVCCSLTAGIAAGSNPVGRMDVQFCLVRVV
jgi:hypothetical protein